MKKLLKSSLVFVLVVTLSLTLISCGGKDDSSANEVETASNSVESSEVGRDPNSTDKAISIDGSITTGDAIKKDKKSKEKDKNNDAQKSNNKASDKKSSDSPSNKTKKKSDKKEKKESENITCSISIDCKNYYKEEPDKANKLSQKGVILSKKTVALKKDATVYDSLKASGVSFSGSNYITTINGLSEFDGGKKSGWMYLVNGNVYMETCKKTKLKDGDNIVWRYTLSSGADI